MVNREFVQIIKKKEVKMALKKLGLKREVWPGPMTILLRSENAMARKRVKWLPTLFNKDLGK